ncbi:malignant fibrous histiocytoma-amplified sequence 1 homolog [Lingula anatina]|uniref:Malignant fibrous histiocytoma-amplified sequence 1 homolog n=1 Tax=Lingula anatina TaxID=7574 RepID=A0A1S3GZG3_LINAN|nr:malignant fibrous histiocytoma-amplified sequence 1 homolog [Lingula anatina]|eukprot:XP_013379138.1 malignant fibrous histiocytoma-amplified sequence 1 homolog [Lingula anatina]
MSEEVIGGVEVLESLLDLERRPADDKTPIPDMVTKCTVLELKCKNIKHIPNTIDRCINVKKINLTGNMLSSIPGSLYKLKNLTHLYLGGNQLTELQASMCALSHIEDLNLHNDEQSSLPPDIGKLSALKSLNLGWNQLTEIPASVCALPHIENLDLQHNKLSTLPPDIGKLTTLKNLDLGDNWLTKLPDSVCALPRIGNLVLRSNKLFSLPADIGKLTTLKNLDLGDNRLTELPASVCALPHIENLVLWGNNVSRLPADIGKLTTLKSLDLSNNQLTVLPASVCALPHIENLDLQFNKLSSLPADIGKLTTLKSLDLSSNQLTKLPASVRALPHIENLDLNFNKLSSLPADIGKLTTLTCLDLSYNQFTDLPASVCALPHIEKLNLKGNKLPSLPISVSKMVTLKYLDISSNNITHLPHQLASLTLYVLNVDDNLIQQPPMSVCEAGQEAIFRYLIELRESEAVESCRLQLNLLGETGSGKTSLARSLRRGIPVLTDVADRTRVVEQSLWEIEGNISFNINDFGGHEVYRVGHRIFISQNSIVLVTFDLSTYDPRSSSYFRQHIGVWIDMVQSHNPGVTIALVGTHLDKTDEVTSKAVCASVQEVIESERIKRQDWFTEQARELQVRIHALQKDKNEVLTLAYKRKIEALNKRRGQNQSRIYPHIFMVSSKTQAGFGDLKDYLSAQAKERSVTLPKTWHEAAKTIYAKKESKTENTLCWDNVKQDVVYANNTAKYIWSKIRGRTDNNVNAILSFLSSRGDVIWYPNNPILSNIIFHRQEVLADLLKAILSHDKDEFLNQVIVSEPMAEKIKEDFIMRGVLSVQVMEDLWKPFGLTARESSAMVELMQRLELCFKVNEGEDGATFHFPWLLELSRPPIIDTKWPQSVPQDTTQLTLNVYFPYRCPDGLYEKLSVRLHSTLGLYQPMRRDWKDGVFVDKASHCMQMSRSQTDRNWVITIAVRGQYLPDLWKILLQNHDNLMDILEEDWPGLPCDKYLVCPHCTSLDVETPTLFPGEVIDQPPAETVDRVPCWKTKEMIPADLIYPNMPGLTAMKPHQKRALKQHMELLVSNITTPCLSYLLDKLMQEDIITDREKQYVRSKPSTGDTDKAEGAAAASVVSPEQTRTLLNILLTKEERAFQCLCRCLEKIAQGFLAKKLKR